MSEIRPEFIARDRVEIHFEGLIPKTLANLASLGKGPPYHKVGRRCFYRYEDLVNWITRSPIKTKS